MEWDGDDGEGDGERENSSCLGFLGIRFWRVVMIDSRPLGGEMMRDAHVANATHLLLGAS